MLNRLLDSLVYLRKGRKMSEQQRLKEPQEKAVRYFCSRPGNFPVGGPYNCCESALLKQSV